MHFIRSSLPLCRSSPACGLLFMPQLGKVTGQSVWSDVYLATSDTRTASNEGVLGVIDGVGIPYRPLCVRLSLDQQASTSKTVHACNMSARDITVRRSSAPCASHTPDKRYLRTTRATSLIPKALETTKKSLTPQLESFNYLFPPPSFLFAAFWGLTNHSKTCEHAYLRSKTSIKL